MTKVIGVRFKPQGKVYFFSPGELPIEKGSYVVVETSRGDECGEVSAAPHMVNDEMVKKPLRGVKRMADGIDIRRMEQNRQDEKAAFPICEEHIARHKLDMKLVDVEYAFDRSKILFYFTADGRIDFRDLVKDLAGAFRARIELRQIGVRDESKMLGGLGICGQMFCCSRFLSDFQPVSIKMAKEQGLTLNPTKISGACGRLMCCLAYEQPAYDYLNRITPSAGSVVKTPDGLGTVVDVSVVAGWLKVRLDANPAAPAKQYTREQVEYIRGGRGKKRPEREDSSAGEDTFVDLA